MTMLMNLKKISRLTFIFFLAALAMTSCSSGGKVKIGMMIPNSVKERYPKENAYFTSRVNELGGEVITANALDDDKLQAKQAEDLINQGVKVLVVIPVNKNTASVIVRHAQQKGIVVIAYERIIANCDLDYYISFDNVKVGEMIAGYATKIKPEGTYIILGGDYSDQNAIWVKNGILNILSPMIKSGKIKIGYDSFVEDWGADNAQNEVDTYLRLSGTVPDAILSCSDAMSNASLKALATEQVPIDQYPVITGQNGELQALKNIAAGRQSMTVYKPIKNEAEEAAVLAMHLARHEKPGNITQTSFNGKIDVPSILLNPILVDASNIKSTVVADGSFKESDIYE